jgi:hypothetical protein
MTPQGDYIPPSSCDMVGKFSAGLFGPGGVLLRRGGGGTTKLFLDLLRATITNTRHSQYARDLNMALNIEAESPHNTFDVCIVPEVE